MRFNAPPISELRLQRYHRWMLLWLKRLAAFLMEAGAFALLSRQAKQLAHHWLDDVERLLTNIVLIRAARRVRTLPTLKHASHRRAETHMRRAIVGSAMRRALRSHRLDRRIAALSQDVEALIERLLKRLPRGLTRRRPIRTRPEMFVAHAALFGAQAPLRADTS
jgi:hypothetical protein